MEKKELSIWTVYDHPKDFPKHFVAREFVSYPGRVVATGNTIQSEDLETIRETLLTQMGKTCLGRNPQDQANIIESWI